MFQWFDLNPHYAASCHNMSNNLNFWTMIPIPCSSLLIWKLCSGTYLVHRCWRKRWGWLGREMRWQNVQQHFRVQVDSHECSFAWKAPQNIRNECSREMDSALCLVYWFSVFREFLKCEIIPKSNPSWSQLCSLKWWGLVDLPSVSATSLSPHLSPWMNQSLVLMLCLSPVLSPAGCYSTEEIGWVRVPNTVRNYLLFSSVPPGVAHKVDWHCDM